jgi:hypothetical protein
MEGSPFGRDEVLRRLNGFGRKRKRDRARRDDDVAFENAAGGANEAGARHVAGFVQAEIDLDASRRVLHRDD